jgi:general secretion pathway protein D
MLPIMMSGGKNIASIPLQLSYDPNRLTLVNVSSGNFLSKDGQAVALIHRDDGPGNVTIVASRPPGTAGVSGDGTVCVLTFQAKVSGSSVINITHAGVVDSKQQMLPAQSMPASIMVK